MFVVWMLSDVNVCALSMYAVSWFRCACVSGGAFACMSTAGQCGGSTAGTQCAQLTASTTGTG